MKVLNRDRLHISAICVGTAERLIAKATGFARDRFQFGKPIAENLLIEAMRADSGTEAYAGRCVVPDAARFQDQRPGGGELHAVLLRNGRPRRADPWRRRAQNIRSRGSAAMSACFASTSTSQIQQLLIACGTLANA